VTELYGLALKIHVSEGCYKFLLKSPQEFVVSLRGEINIKVFIARCLKL